MPVLQPAEAWRKTGRYEIDALFKLTDRKGADLVLAMTHEEAVTTHVAQIVRSYRDLPLILYHFQVKERDEPRPRAGVLRTREFIMKDSYTFDRDAAGLDERYELHVGAYDRIMERSRPALLPRRGRRGDDGRLRRPRVHGAVPRRRERRRARRAATPPTSRSQAPSRRLSTLPGGAGAPEAVSTPGLTTVRDVAARPRRARGGAAQGLPGDRQRRPSSATAARAGAAARRSPRQRDQARARARRAAAALRGPRRSRRARPARLHRPGRRSPATSRSCSTAPSSPGPTGGVCDGREPRRSSTCAASSPDATSPSARPTCATVVPGRHDRRRRPSTIEPAIEIGNIFKLGTRYSEPLGATLPRRERRRAADLDGLLRHRPGPHRRRRRRAVRRRARASPGRARSRPSTSTSSTLGKPGTPEREAADRVYEIARGGRAGGRLRRPRPRPRREVRRRRAARLPAAADRRAPLAGVRRDRGSDPPRPRAGAAALALDAEPEALLRRRR